MLFFSALFLKSSNIYLFLTNMTTITQVQAYIRHCEFGSRPLQQGEYYNTVSHDLSAGGGSCLQFVKKMQHLLGTIKQSTQK